MSPSASATSASSLPGPVSIRPATPSDIPTIISLIQDLATYEKEPDAAKATPELIQENIFDQKYAECLLAEVQRDTESEVVGIAIYFFSFSTWTASPSLYLEDLFVPPPYRNQGIGKLLFSSLGRIAKERKCLRVDWQVLDWNENSVQFYRKVLGARPMDGWTQMRLEGDEEIERLIQIGQQKK